MKIVTVVGGRPQLVKSSVVSKAIVEAGHKEYMIHTGQHYDFEMSQVFFKELGIPKPAVNLNVGSGTHAYQTGQILMRIEPILIAQKPDIVLVYGDMNSTLAGALAAVKLHLRVGHIEAGLRSYNRQMPEEYNRILTDHCSDLLFCPTRVAVGNLAREGIKKGVHLVGDTVCDAAIQFSKIASKSSVILKKLSLKPKNYLLATIHRPYNTDEKNKMKNIFLALGGIREKIIFPIHPRTRQSINKMRLSIPKNITAIKPVGYLDMLILEKNARLIITDSGGMQKEAYLFSVPCITLRTETEWTETVKAGWNLVVGADRKKIINAIKNHHWPKKHPIQLFDDENAGRKIISLL